MGRYVPGGVFNHQDVSVLVDVLLLIAVHGGAGVEVKVEMELRAGDANAHRVARDRR
jgi:hypothetical protein